MDIAELDRLFTFHPPAGDEAERYRRITAAARAFAEEINACTPASADQTAAIRLVREARMTANAAIACRDRERAVLPELAPVPKPGEGHLAALARLRDVARIAYEQTEPMSPNYGKLNIYSFRAFIADTLSKDCTATLIGPVWAEVDAYEAAAGKR